MTSVRAEAFYSKEAACCFYLMNIVQGLVDNLHEIKIFTEPISEDRFVVHIKVARDDVGKIIGKEGRIARSIRTLAFAYASREQIRLQLNLVETKE
jgi:predicted RNA-binding protein YlqC (UPF0109 family)